MHGSSTGRAPIHVNKITVFVKIQNVIDITNVITPPSLLGIDRRIAYASRKYHSGWISNTNTAASQIVEVITIVLRECPKQSS
jgi:hypothetical protein